MDITPTPCSATTKDVALQRHAGPTPRNLGMNDSKWQEEFSDVTKDLEMRRQRWDYRRDHPKVEAEAGGTCLELGDRGRCHRPSNVGGLYKLEKARKRISPAVSKRNQPSLISAQ